MSAALANPSKQKGTAFESVVVEYFKAHGFPTVERRALHGNTDKGDIAGLANWTFELKNRKALDIGGALDEARTEAKNAGTALYAAIVKRPRKGDPGEAFAVMPLALLVDLIHLLEFGRFLREQDELSRQQRIAGG